MNLTPKQRETIAAMIAVELEKAQEAEDALRVELLAAVAKGNDLRMLRDALENEP